MKRQSGTRMENFSEFLGWYGVFAIVLAYGLLSFGNVSGEDVSYQLLNLTGAAGILIDAWMDKNWQPVALNIVWIIIAFVALVRLW